MSKGQSKKADSKKRAKRGEGSLYKIGSDGKQYPTSSKKPGTFWVAYTVTGADGRKKRIRKALRDDDGEPIRDLETAKEMRKRIVGQYVTAGSVAALQSLQKELADARNDHQKALDEAYPPLKIEDAWDTYLNHPERPDSGQRTLSDYSGYWNKFTDWLGEQDGEFKYMRDIQPETAQEYAKYLTQSKLSPNTFNKNTGFLKLIFRVLEEPSRTNDNPFGRIRKKTLKTNVRRELTLAELKTILTTAKGDLQLLLSLGTFTGLRLGDCATLKWGEVDLERGLIRRVPNKTAARKKNPVVVGIPSALHAILTTIPVRRRKGFVLPAMAEKYDRDPSIITKQIQKFFEDECDIQTLKDKTGKVWYDKAVEKWKKGGRKGPKPVYQRGVIEVGFHSLRHTYVSLHAAKGTPQAVLQAVVGHGNPAMTQHYVHVGEDTARAVAGALNIGVTDAEYEELPEPTPDPIPDWAIERLESMTTDNWETIRGELLKRNKR